MSVVARLQKGGGELVDITPVLEGFAKRIRCEISLLQAILEVESGGDDYDGQGRLIILPEKHIFHRKLPKSKKAKALAIGLSARKWKRSNYKGLGGKGSDRRWALMARWAKLDETAALLSASYAAPQIMGFNYKICGYSSVTDFVEALALSNSASAEAFLKFLENSGLADELREGDIKAIVRRYNGPGQVAKYSAMIRRALARIKKGSVAKKAKLAPRFSMLRLGSSGYRVKALQQQLCDLGYHVKVDGDFGPATRRQIVAFQVDHGLKVDGLVGPKSQAALDVAVPINQQAGGGREDLTIKDLRKSGSQTVKKADWLTRLGASIFGTGTLASGLGQADTGGLFDGLGGLTDSIKSAHLQLQPLLNFVASNKWFAFILVGLAVLFIANQIKQRRLSDAKDWRHVG